MRHHIINGEVVPFTPEEEMAQDAVEAAYEAGQPARDRDTANALILLQITEKETEALRSQRELMREQHFPGDLSLR